MDEYISQLIETIRQRLEDHITCTIGAVLSDGERMYDKAHTALQRSNKQGVGQFNIYQQ